MDLNVFFSSLFLKDFMTANDPLVFFFIHELPFLERKK